MAPEVAADVKVRRLRASDLQKVTRIDAQHTGRSKPAYWKGVFKRFLARAAATGGVALAATQDGRLVGYLFGDVRAFEFGSEACGWVFAIGVDPAALRSGVATALLGEARTQFAAAGVTVVRTMVRRNEVPVLSFFRAAGFVGGPFVQLELGAEGT